MSEKCRARGIRVSCAGSCFHSRHSFAPTRRLLFCRYTNYLEEKKKIGIIHERGSLHCHSLIFVHLPYPYTPVLFLFSLQPCIVSPSLEKGECLGEETVC